MINSELERYLHDLTPLHDELLLEMERFAENGNVPIIERPSIRFIQNLLGIKGNVNHILEIGTAIGYSTIWLAKGAKQAEVDTIERDAERAEHARAYVERAQLLDRIHIHIADATSYAEQLKEKKYDIIFIDAAKGQYRLFFQEYAQLLHEDGIVITDNVFFHGEVVKEHIENRRIRSLVKKIKEYNVWLRNHPEYITSFIPIGDGLAISRRRENNSGE